MAMTPAELEWSGEVVNFWPSQSAIDANRPRIMLVQRTEIGAQTYVHGRVLGTISNADTTRGDPEEQGFTPGGFARVQMAASPTIGMATVRTNGGEALAAAIAELESAIDEMSPGARAYGSASSHPASAFLSLALSSASWQTLTGGSISADASGVAWNATTGVLTVSEAGAYLVSASVSQGRLLGITSPLVTMAVWTASEQTQISGRHALPALESADSLAAAGVLRLAAGDQLRLRLLSSGNTTVEVSDFTLTAVWIAP